MSILQPVRPSPYQRLSSGDARSRRCARSSPRPIKIGIMQIEVLCRPLPCVSGGDKRSPMPTFTWAYTPPEANIGCGPRTPAVPNIFPDHRHHGSGLIRRRDNRISRRGSPRAFERVLPRAGQVCGSGHTFVSALAPTSRRTSGYLGAHPPSRRPFDREPATFSSRCLAEVPEVLSEVSRFRTLSESPCPKLSEPIAD
jgi:hypothetical protein